MTIARVAFGVIDIFVGASPTAIVSTTAVSPKANTGVKSSKNRLKVNMSMGCFLVIIGLFPLSIKVLTTRFRMSTMYCLLVAIKLNSKAKSEPAMRVLCPLTE